MPARVLLQDFTGVPAVVDLAAMRDAMAAIGGDPAQIEPLVPADLVIDHSVQVDRYRTADAFAFNVDREYERNGERYQLLRWAQSAFNGLRVVPPGTGIVHQVNLEYLAQVVVAREDESGETVAFPDTLVGTDSHTTMVNGLGVLGYGVGGIEAEAVLLGQPLYQPMPRVIGVRLHGDLPRGSTATDLVLVVTQMLRAHGVVGLVRRVRRRWPGVAWRWPTEPRSRTCRPSTARRPRSSRSTTRRSTYLRMTGRDESLISSRRGATPRRTRCGASRAPGPDFDETLELDLCDGRADRRRAAPAAGQGSAARPACQLPRGLPARQRSAPPVEVSVDSAIEPIDHGSVAIAAITSAAPTRSNPTVMIGAGPARAECAGHAACRSSRPSRRASRPGHAP